MKSTTRRQFLEQSSAAVAGAAALSLSPSLHAANANEKIVMGIIGPGGMGMRLLNSFAAEADVAVSYVCDPDSKRAEAAARTVEKITGTRPKVEKDMRRVLDDKTVDAVVVATPDHWHAPATILACEAAKHVYVEKPCCHNLREGRLMIEAARRNKRVVQTGTQSRSSAHIQQAIKLLRDGAIGEVLVAKAWNSQKRGTIGRAQPAAPPPELDFDLWLGPAPAVQYQSNLLHSAWRWWYAFGCGDMGNDGVHDIDIARWGLGVEQHPQSVAAMGGKYFFDDDQQFPDTQYVMFEYPPSVPAKRRKQLIFEQRIWSPYVQEGHENGNAFYGTDGMLILGKGRGWQLFGPRNELRQKSESGLDDKPHHRNFIECIRSGHLPNADIEIGHYSAALCHLGNIATRLGRVLPFDPQTEKSADAEADKLLGRTYRDGHWAALARG